jgi:Protein of unknown function (DUF3047)
MPLRKDKSVPKQFLSTIWTMTGRLTTLAASTLLASTLLVTALASSPLAYAAGAATAAATGVSAFSSATGSEPPAPWRIVGLPDRYAKPVAQFDITELDGKKVVRVRADKAYGNLVHDWKGPLGSLRWRWRLDNPLLNANLKSKNTEDIALKVCLTFDMPADQIPSAERSKFKLAQFFSRDKLPTATLCYVWAHAEAAGAELTSPYTGRVRYVVLNSGEGQLKTWQDHTRSISADFLKAFGAESPTVPAVTAIIVGADSDNTEGASLGYVADMVVQP